MNTVVRRRAGSLPQADTRKEARYLSHHDYAIALQAEAARPAHTMSPPERDYQRTASDDLARARFWWVIGGIYVAFFAGVYLCFKG